MGVDDDQLLVIQNDLRERLKARDEARERAVTRKLRELEQKHEFVNSKFLKHFAQVSEQLELTIKDGQAKVKPADKMLMIQPYLMVKHPKKQRRTMEDSINILSFKQKKVIYDTRQKRPLNYLNIHQRRKL